MNQMGFNILKRAQDNMKASDGLNLFLNERGINILQVKRNPKYYEGLLLQYSKECINEGLFQESKAHMENEFNRLCDFHRRNEQELVNKFFHITQEIILDEKDYNEDNE